jgi:ATP-dependent Lhr-like helicase
VTGAHVLLWDGTLVAYLARGDTSLVTFLPATEPEHSRAARAVGETLANLVDRGQKRALFICLVDGQPSHASGLSPHLVEAGFSATNRGHLKRARRRRD